MAKLKLLWMNQNYLQFVLTSILWWKENLLLSWLFWADYRLREQAQHSHHHCKEKVSSRFCLIMKKNVTLLFSPQSGGLCWCHVAFLVSYRLDQSQIILGWQLQLNKTRTNKLPLFFPISQHQHWLFNSKVCLLSFIKFHIQVCRSQAISWSWDTCHMSYGWVRRMDGAWKRGESRKSPLISRDDGHRRASTATREWYEYTEYTALARLGYGVTSFSDGNP